MIVKHDQHFLREEFILNKIVDCAQINLKDEILEIGPGDGELTERILDKKPRNLTSIEIDKNFIDILGNIQSINDNFNVIFDNSLEQIEQLNFNKVISNLPYSITEPFYKKILDREDVKILVLTHGKRFYNLIIDINSKWNRFVNSFFHVELIQEISGKDFEPETKVKSVTLKLTRKEKPTEKEKFIQNLYKKRDRNVKNAMIYSFVDSYGISKREAKEKLEELNIPEELYGKVIDNLSNEEIMQLL